MNTIIQIPAYNEENTLRSVVEQIKEFDFYIVIIDDGSEDSTSEIAKAFGVDHIITHEGNLGLGEAFRSGQEYAIKQGADILVNTDGDNQYPGRYIPDLIAPIMNGTADIVIGNRQTWQVPHFSFTKKCLQWIGTKMVSLLAGEPNIKDAVSGFRAYNRKALMALNITSKFSYVLDTTIQAKAKGLRIASVDITTNPPTRPSRLFRSTFHHIRKSAMDIIRVYAMYRAMRVFIWIGVTLLLIGLIPMVRFGYDYFLGGGGEGKIQSLIIGSTFIMSSVIMFALGIIADLLSKNRILIERLLEKEKREN